MAKTRLNQSHRELLREHARAVLTRVIRHENNADAIDRAMLKLVQARIKEEYPPKDMAVLSRYEKGAKVDQIKVSLDGSCSRLKNYSLPESTWLPEWWPTIVVTGEAASAWFNLQEKFQAEFDKRFPDYRALIHRATTLEEILEAWPLAAKVRDKIASPNGGAVVPVDDAVLRRIRRDSAVASKMAPASGAAK